MTLQVVRPLPLLAALALQLGCNGAGSSSTQPSSTASASTAPPTVSPAGSSSAAPSASAKKPPPTPYEGPVGSVSGVITIKGDEPPLTNHKYEPECEGASGMYGKLFRVGQDGQLADAIVAVTKYKGYVAPKKEVIDVTIKKCQYSTRAIALTDGQHIAVRNLDLMTSYVPHLDGARIPAAMVAVPRGEAVPLRSRGPGRYWLRDQMGRNFMVAHVFHFRYSTTAVTGLDGKYRIEGIPVGKVEVSVLLPEANMKNMSQPYEVKEGDNKLDLELVFDEEADMAKGGAKKDAPKKTDAKGVPKNDAKGVPKKAQ